MCLEEGAVRGDRVTRGAWDVLTVVLPARRHDTWRRERGERRRKGRWEREEGGRKGRIDEEREGGREGGREV